MPRPDIAELAAWYGDPDHYDPRVLRALAYIAELEAQIDRRWADDWLRKIDPAEFRKQYLGDFRPKIRGVDPATGRVIYDDELEQPAPPGSEQP